MITQFSLQGVHSTRFHGHTVLGKKIKTVWLRAGQPLGEGLSGAGDNVGLPPVLPFFKLKCS